ncbi:MAG: PEP-CTERM sorting domain-containing protein [Nitrospirae bacterium]|nr:MAG: PEP-CTERM sorting domain-containing protein [Nitrospirota bacterium]
MWFGSFGGIYNDDAPYKSWNYYESGPTGGWEGTLELTAVPEPSMLLLLGSGLAGLALFRKKFKVKTS